MGPETLHADDFQSTKQGDLPPVEPCDSPLLDWKSSPSSSDDELRRQFKMSLTLYFINLLFDKLEKEVDRSLLFLLFSKIFKARGTTEVI